MGRFGGFIWGVKGLLWLSIFFEGLNWCSLSTTFLTQSQLILWFLKCIVHGSEQPLLNAKNQKMSIQMDCKVNTQLTGLTTVLDPESSLFFRILSLRKPLRGSLKPPTARSKCQSRGKQFARPEAPRWSGSMQFHHS